MPPARLRACRCVHNEWQLGNEIAATFRKKPQADAPSDAQQMAVVGHWAVGQLGAKGLGYRQVHGGKTVCTPATKEVNCEVFIALALGKPEHRSLDPLNRIGSWEIDLPVPFQERTGSVSTIWSTASQCD